jgi:hypothetical protein
MVIRIRFDVVNPADRTEARLDFSGIARQPCVQANTLGIQQGKVRSAIG